RRHDGLALVVHLEHQLVRLLAVHAEQHLEHVGHVAHGVDRVIPHDALPWPIRLGHGLGIDDAHRGGGWRGHAPKDNDVRDPVHRATPGAVPTRLVGVTNPMAPTPESTALLTDKYELTMLQASLRDGTADRKCAFEVFGRRLPNERRYGVVAGTARVLDAISRFRFTEDQLATLAFLDAETLDYLRNYRFTGDIDGYREGELYFPASPILTVRGTFAECVILETVILSILNADSAIASAAARMVTAAGGRPIIEMG